MKELKHPDILYEDNHLIAVNKPACILSQSDKTGDPSMVNYVKEYIRIKYHKPGNVYVHPVHRLDRPVSGVILFCKTSKSLIRMQKLFRERQLDKVYLALSSGSPQSDKARITHFLKKDRERNKAIIRKVAFPDSKKAILEYERLGMIGKYNLFKIVLFTGRPHQIRAQMSYIGCPIVGDLKYGATKPTDDLSIRLHARSLKFAHPVKKEVVDIQAPIPKNWPTKLIIDLLPDNY